MLQDYMNIIIKYHRFYTQLCMVNYQTEEVDWKTNKNLNLSFIERSEEIFKTRKSKKSRCVEIGFIFYEAVCMLLGEFIKTVIPCVEVFLTSNNRN